jgi:hypothetical protein
MNVKLIAIGHLQPFGSVRRLHSGALEQEANRVGRLALALAESGHELLEPGRALDLEEDLIVVIGDFDVEMGAVDGGIRCAARAAVVVFARHVLLVFVVLEEMFF